MAITPNKSIVRSNKTTREKLKPLFNATSSPPLSFTNWISTSKIPISNKNIKL